MALAHLARLGGPRCATGSSPYAARAQKAGYRFCGLRSVELLVRRGMCPALGTASEPPTSAARAEDFR